MTIEEAHVAVRTRLGLTQDQLASRLGEHRVTVAKRERGLQGVSSDAILRLAEEAGLWVAATPDGWQVVTPSDLMPDNPERDTPYLVAGPTDGVPVVGSAGAGEPCRLYDEPEEWLDIGREWKHHVDVAVKIRGDSMAPLILDHDWVGIRKGSEGVRPGDVVAVLDLREQDLQVKIFWGIMRTGMMVLMSYNPDASPIHYEDGTAEIIGTVWGVYRPSQVRVRVV